MEQSLMDFASHVFSVLKFTDAAENKKLYLVVHDKLNVDVTRCNSLYKIKQFF